jgi:hypothetical protein
MRLYFHGDHRSAFLACLGIGTLKAIQVGAMPPTAGAWTLARPRLWLPLATSMPVPEEIVSAFRSSGQLAAQHSAVTMNKEIAGLIGRLLEALKRDEDGDWSVSWSVDPEWDTDVLDVALIIPEDNLAAFLACLGIGTLEAIRTGALPTTAGIWTLARPRVWEPLAVGALVPDEIVSVYQTCDELHALEQLAPDKLITALTELIDRLVSVLAQAEMREWHIEWVSETAS